MIWPGAGPRAVLAYAPTKGATSDLELVLGTEITASGQGGPLPVLTVASTLAVEDVLPDRSARLRLTVREITAREHPGSTMPADAMTQHMQPLRGLSLVGTLHPDGVISDLHPEAAVRLPPGLEQHVQNMTMAFQQFALPLPRTAVGDGAMWQLTRDIVQGGMKLRSVTNVQLGTREGSTIPYTVASSLFGANQTVEMLGMKVSITHLGGTAHARGSVDLAGVNLTGTASFELGSDMSIAGQTDHMVMRLDAKLAKPGSRSAPSSGDAPPPD